MLWIVVGVLLILWLGGFVLNVVGGLIHALLVLAIVIAVATFFLGRRSPSA